MKILICIDDTDNHESRGTGHLAEDIRKAVEEKFSSRTTAITRHQLYVSDEIPYTSHNSTMCFTAEIEQNDLNRTIDLARDFLLEKSAPGSDPGLCVAVPDNLKNTDKLIKFGTDATCRVLTKDMAYSLAHELGVHLSEHGGTGGGVIGALAGTGLRLGGNNGRFRGWVPVEDNDRTITVEELCSKYAVDQVRERYGSPLAENQTLTLTEKVKTVFLDHMSVLPVKNMNGIWQNITREEIKQY